MGKWYEKAMGIAKQREHLDQWTKREKIEQIKSLWEMKSRA
jgi:hypothetical protein